MLQHILIVEDEPAIAETLVYALSTEGFQPVWRATGREALDAFRECEFSLAILDVGLPDFNGFDLFREIQRHRPIPVIFLTARSGEVDRVVGLEIGADDYVCKPFSPREVCARVRTVLRRAGKAEAAPRPAPEGNKAFIVDDERKSIAYRGVPLDLSKTEYRLLKTLVERPGRVYTREELMQKAWDHPEVSLDRTVDAHVKQLRAKLKAVAPDDDPIQTHRGIGYSLREQA